MSIFSKIRLTKPKSSTFNLSHDRKFSLNMGDLVPILCQEVVPGDNFSVSTQQMLRFAPMISPVMHEVNVFTHYFFVPNRIVCDHWEDFITGGDTGFSDSIFPIVEDLEVTPGSLADYLGLPIAASLNLEISMLPFMAYNKIYDEYYRDQNLTQEMPWPKISTDWAGNHTQAFYKGQSPTFFNLKRRAWQHDYFTSALPWAQKGEPVRLPLVNTAGSFLEVDWTDETHFGTKVKDKDGNAINLIDGKGVHVRAGSPTLGIDDSPTFAPLHIDNTDNLRVPLDNLETEAATINDLRTAFKVQEWLEKNARAGSRYIESILSHFGVRSSDARLQRPEFLGGGMSPVMISEVLQTANTSEGTTPLGEMGGHGLNLNKNYSFNRFFEEHGYIIGIMSVMPKTAYQQGVPRHFSKFNRYDYFWPEFQHLGEQEILNKELIYTNDVERDNATFGYIPRYSEYRYIPSSVHGDFKSSLDFWHLGRIFDPENPPVLNEDFIMSDPSRRIFAVEESEEQTLYCHLFHNINAKRRMSYFGEPSFR